MFYLQLAYKNCVRIQQKAINKNQNTKGMGKQKKKKETTKSL